MRALAVPAIRFYQRRLSPYKGFCCAYRAHTGRASCSELGLRVIRRFGLFCGLVLLRQRLYRCGVASRRYGAVPPRRGSCDAPCDLPCDGDLRPNCSHCLDCADCGNSDREKRKRRRPQDEEQERRTRLPPRREPP